MEKEEIINTEKLLSINQSLNEVTKQVKVLEIRNKLMDALESSKNESESKIVNMFLFIINEIAKLKYELNGRRFNKPS